MSAVHPSSDAVRIALSAAYKQRPKTVCRTIVLKLHKPSRRKEHALLWAQTQVTNMTAHVLESLREHPGEIRHDRALACIQEMYSRQAQGEKGARTQILAAVLSECFRGGTPRVRRRPKLRGVRQVHAARLATPRKAYRHKKLHITRLRPATVPKIGRLDYPVSGPLRDGVFRQVALMLLNWSVRIQGLQDAVDDETDEVSGADIGVTDLIPAIKELHTSWSEQMNRFTAASNTTIPFGRHRGKSFAEAGKREVRWLQERLIPTAVVEETLKHLEVLLNQRTLSNPDPLERFQHIEVERYQQAVADQDSLQQAQRARHPWRRQANFQRSPRANRLTQRGQDKPQPLIRLSALSDDEKLRLRDELQEMLNFAQEFDKIREAANLFLSAAPPSYPTVHPVLVGKGLKSVQGEYEEALTELQKRFPEQVEAETELVHNFLKTAGKLAHPEFQPVSFKRTMRPPQRTSFALLYATSIPKREKLEKKYRKLPRAKRSAKVDQVMNEGLLYTYVLAVVLHGASAFKGEDSPEQFAAQVDPGLFYVNYPETPFTVPNGSNVILFPLEFGEKYQEQQFLRCAIETQRRQQHRKYQKLQAAKRPKKLQDCLPKAIIGSARIISKRTDEGHYEFYLHLPIKTELAKPQASAQNVLGIHEHSQGYSYALVGAEGTVIRTGDVPVPEHVQPRSDATSYSDNYVYEVVKQMIGLANPSNQSPALIGLNVIDWSKTKVHLARDQNRIVFRRPSVKVLQTLKYKTLLAGLPRTHETWGVSPHECSRCGERRDRGSKNFKPHEQICPGCGADEVAMTGNEELCCQACESIWNPDELWFQCEHCGHRQAARLNTAIVVARYTRSQIVARYNEKEAKAETTDQP